MFRALASRVPLKPKVVARCSSSGAAYSDHLRAVPFGRTLPEAVEAYKSFHKSLISYLPSSSPDVKQSFLPFWAVSTMVHVRIEGAHVGYDRTGTRYNSKGQPEVYHYTKWKWVSWSSVSGPSWEQLHDSNQEEGLQVYASYRYRRAYVNGMRGGGCFTGASRLTPEMVELGDGTVAGLEEFVMRPGVAIGLARKYVEGVAYDRASALLMQMYKADEVADLRLWVSYKSLVASPVYVPVFVFRSSYLGEEVRTFVHGSTLAVGGQRLYHAPLVALAGGGVVAGVVGLVTGSVPAGVVAGAAAVAGVLAVLYPVLALRIREFARRREEARDATRNLFGEAVEDWVNAYGKWDRWEEARRESRRAEEERRRAEEEYWKRQGGGGGEGGSYYRQEAAPARAPDGKGHYKALGVEAGASVEEVKAAFRAMALKHHPDRYTEPKEIEEANRRFQRITAAYEVLRDPKKKRVYDESSGSGS